MGNDLLVKGVPERVVAPPSYSLMDPACPAEAARELLLELLQQVAGNSPGRSRDAETWRCMHMHTLQGRVKTVNLDAVFARAAYCEL